MAGDEVIAGGNVFEGFENRTVACDDGLINLKVGGNGPPLLLLHGYPQNHIMWHKIAPQLAQRFTVIASDLRGYGDSFKPKSVEDHSSYSKRAMANEQVQVMASLGFDRFSVVGHDRGARVAHRMARDHPSRIDKLVVMDIAPTATMYGNTDKAFATAYYHWFFLIQPFDLPERMIGADPAFYLSSKLKAWGRTEGAITAEAFSEYRRCFSMPETIHASCEDYRAAATIDLEHDQANGSEKISHPLLVLWGAQGFVGATYDVLATWREVASDVQGFSVPGGHFLPEEAPDDVLKALLEFL